ncbi:hypothetical protein BDV93DRAFT_528088 [Ceratobasidium sp. AG-I]|nr:hypothetical protein BDV93DRAFT_528088 [Ceratobasidium sp. AG-I]
MIEALPGVARQNPVRDRDTGDYRNLTIIDCEHEEAAWNIVDYLNREAPQYRVAFITDKRTQERRNGPRDDYRRSGGNFVNRNRDGNRDFRDNRGGYGGGNRDRQDRYSRPPRQRDDYSRQRDDRPPRSSDDF